jgi:hypothetical protein
MSTPLIIVLGILYAAAGIYCALPSLHDARTCFIRAERGVRGTRSEGLMFVVAAVVMAILSPLVLVYQFALYLPSLIEHLPAP